MTVHWEHAPSMQERWPELLLERSLYILDRKRITCAGGTAPMDLMHYLISEHHGQDFARRLVIGLCILIFDQPQDPKEPV